MKKIIKLTESDLVRIVKRVINEQKPISVSDLGKLPTGFMNAPEDVKKGFQTGCYTVKSGDQLLKIAMKFGITLDEIKSLNGLRNTDIQPGQVLRVKNTTKFKGC